MKRKNKATYLLIIAMIMAAFPFCGVKAQKVILYENKAWEYPDFEANFEVLKKNRVVYNTYNDSIFLIHDHDQWVNFFRRRALKNHQIFLANQVALKNIFDYFKRDTIPADAYKSLIDAFYSKNLMEQANDPFLTIRVCDVCQDFFDQCPDSLNMSNILNYYKAEALVEIANVSKDTILYAQSADYFKQIVSEKSARYPYYEALYPEALQDLTIVTFLQAKVMTVEEQDKYLKKFREWYLTHQDSEQFNPKRMRFFKSQLDTHMESLLRNVYMVDSTVMDKQLAENMMRKIIDRNLANKNLSDISYVRTLTMQVRLGQITASQAVKLYLNRYKASWKVIQKKRLTPDGLKAYLMPFYSFFYLNDISNDSYSRKRGIVKRMCRDIETAYQIREDQQRETTYVKYLNTLTNYPRITKYLKPAERVHFLDALNVATQVTTYAHSVHVSVIAEEIMKGILAYEPELLVGCLGDKQVSEILANKQKYLSFIHHAGMYHDIGKNTIASVVNNDYRPLTDMEFSIIKKHPEMGMQYLDLAPSLEKYKDTTLGHHKWYNGKGGYPESFDNTKSPKRILIDIVTLSDCLQAATERIGRNYKGDKTFEVVMEEFRRDAGTRYNPDLVNLIDEHPDLAKKLANLIDDGWVEIYYDIYSQYFGK